MIKICPSGVSVLDTPFTNQADITYFSKQAIEITDADNADLIISGTFKKILSSMIRYGQSKKYLLWTIEPRFNKHFSPQISYPLLPNIHIMNVYTGAFSDNYLFAPQHLDSLPMEELSQFKSKKIVSLMTYQAGPQWNFFYKGVDLDLCNLRTKIALEGHSRGVLDIYGRDWPKKIKIGQSRGQGWREKKLTILKEYHFNLCFENTNWPHYCTEKIWDAIHGGCLPIYYGSNNRIYDDFPKNSFLDYCNFNDTHTLLDYIYNMQLTEFQERMSLCVQSFNRVVKCKQKKQPYQKLLEQTVLKIREIIQ